MRWIMDKTGRFPRRPYYEYDELNRLLEPKLAAFMRNRHGRIFYPTPTEDLTVFIETHADDVDLFYDFPWEQRDVEGMTEFFPGKKPRVKIARRLSADHMENRFRSTLCHETVHVLLHAPLFDSYAIGSYQPSSASVYLSRDASVPPGSPDWMEVQAGYGASVLLIPGRPMHHRFSMFREQHNLRGALALGSNIAEDFTHSVALAFQTSEACAKVRLRKAGILFEPLPDLDLVRIAETPVETGLAHCGPMVTVLVAQFGISVSSGSEVKGFENRRRF
jgi:hypothetical protein